MRKKKIAKKLLNKYRLVILNEDTFEEKLSFKLTRLNLFVATTLAIIILISGTIYLIAFTGLKEYIPGYPSTALKQRAASLTYKADSLQRIVELNDRYFTSIRQVLVGDVKSTDLNKDSLMAVQRIEPDQVDLNPSKEDSLLREVVGQEDKYNLLEVATSRGNYSLFPPVKGSISEGYNIKDKHFGVDVVAVEDAAVKVVSDGTVILAEWTAQTGNVIIVEHSYGLVSIYKHNSRLTREQGDRVKKGEVIATVGSTGEFSTGPHLHFELWSDGQPVNPTDFIDFE